MFQKDRLDFFSIGGQVNNSSSRDRASIDRAFTIIKKYKLNTVAFPIYWNVLEPEEGHYSFWQVDYILRQADQQNLKLVLLWFGTWKNGASHFVPDWVKRDHKRFPHVLDALQNETMVLSPLGDETREADSKAFCQLLKHVKETDKNGCVLAVQVENEPGIHASPRDYGQEATKLFEEELPEDIKDLILERSDAALTESWKVAGAVQQGNWRDFFGIEGEEIFSAYYIAKYIEQIARAGKKIYGIPMYVNTWVRETMNRIPGLDYPSGGATSITLGIWKRFAPSLDCLCPDVYFDDRDTYMDVCEQYSRQDNALYIPESHADSINAIHLFEAIERFDLTGIHAFAIDATLDEKGELTPDGEAYRRAVEILASARILLEKYYRTGRIHAVVQQEFADSMFLDFDDWYGRVLFFSGLTDEPYIHLDNIHTEEKYLQCRGKGLIVDAGGGVFYLAGEGFKLILYPKKSATQRASVLHGTRCLNAGNAPYLSVQEGYFDENGVFIAERERNGDEDNSGLWVTSDIGVVRVILDTGMMR